MHGSPIRSELIRLITNHPPGELLYAEDMAAQLNRTVRSVSSGIYNLRREVPEFGEQLTVIVAGKVWRYNRESPRVSDAVPQRPASSGNGRTSAATDDVLTRTVNDAQPATGGDGDDTGVVVDSRPGRLFEELGDVGDGCILVVDEAGNPYKLVPLET